MTTWANPPVDDVGYLSSAELLTWPDHRLHALIAEMRTARYTGWRNDGGTWRDVLGLDTTHDKTVLDYGCGVGMEAIEYDESNRIIVGDIIDSNVALALRVAEIFGRQLVGGLRIYPGLPSTQDRSIDVVHCSGVLHHIREPRSVMEDFHRVLKPDGEVRLMLYSDRGWRYVLGTEPPADVTDDPGFARFVSWYDSVGDYADWYSEAKLRDRFGDLFAVKRCEYMTSIEIFLGAVLRRL